MIDIVLCRSILEKCKSVDAFSGDPENVKMIWRIRQHRMVISEKLMDFYEEHFQKKGPEWLEWYRGFCTDIFYTKERSVIVASLIDRCYIKKNAYYNELVSVALSKETEDNIIVMDSKHRIGQNNIKELGISVFDSRDINDVSGSNLFSMYTLPVNGKAVSEGEDSKSIARWLGRFLREENYIQIYDNYLLTEDGIEHLKKYILKYVEEKTEIEIYSLQNEDFSEQQIKDIFAEEYYKKWKFSIYLVDNKQTLHTRRIQGSKYIIQIDRGISVFGRNGETFQSIIDVFENDGASRIFLEESKLKQIM